MPKSRTIFRLLLATAIISFVAARMVVAEEKVPAPTLPPGVIIDQSPDFKTIHIGSPSIEILPDGSYVATHDFFGSGNDDLATQVFESKDKGATWKKIARIPYQRATYLFYAQDALWGIGWTPGEGFTDVSKDAQCRITISKSNDGGHTWTTPLDSKTGSLIGGTKELSVFCDPAPVLIHNGRIWKEVEQVVEINPNSKPRNWMTQFCPMCMSAPLDGDLLDAATWTFSNAIPWVVRQNEHGWVEGNVLFTPDEKMIIQMRVDDAVNDGKAAQIHLSDDGKTATWDPETGFVEMPGGCKKFVIKYDTKTKKYWSLVNWIHPNDVDAPDKERTRNTLALVCSEDLKKWEIRTIVYRRDNLKIGFQYVDWRVEGDDLACVCRLAWDGAPNCHDANYLTFFRLKNFRTLTRDDDAPTWTNRESK